MNRNIMIVLAGGFLIAVLVALIVQASLSGGKKKQQVATSGELVRIVVAAKDLSTGTELNANNITYKEWPKDALFSGAVQRTDGKKPEEMIEGTLRRAVSEGEPIIKSALVPDNKYNYMTASLAPGMRAYSVRFAPDDIVGGFVKPGDHVDILLTYRSRVNYRGDNELIEDMIETELDERATETILQNVKVIAVGQDIEREDDSENKNKAKNTIITFEVDRKSAEILALSRELGNVSAALRKLGDNTIIAKRPPATTDARVTNIYDEVLTKVYDMEKKSGQNANIVRIYTGVNIEEVTVGQ